MLSVSTPRFVFIVYRLLYAVELRHDGLFYQKNQPAFLFYKSFINLVSLKISLITLPGMVIFYKYIKNEDRSHSQTPSTEYNMKKQYFKRKLYNINLHQLSSQVTLPSIHTRTLLLKAFFAKFKFNVKGYCTLSQSG